MRKLFFTFVWMRNGNDGKEDDFEVGGVNGTCRRQCPVAQKPDEDNKRVHYGYWPEVLSGNWCGEYRENTDAGHERTRKLLNDSEYESKQASQRNTSSRVAFCSGKR